MEKNKFFDNLFKGADGKLFEFSRQLRKESTPAEKIMWEKLRNRKLEGFKFRRQHPIDKYIADFYCAEKKLIVEIDGPIHERKEVKAYDDLRTKDLEGFGIKVIRFKNQEVLSNVQRVLQTISALLKEI